MVRGAPHYRKRHDLSEAPFSGPCAVGRLPADRMLEVAVQFFSEENMDFLSDEMFGGRERLNRRDLQDYHAFGLRPVIDQNINPNERMVPSLVSFQESLQELPGPNLCWDFPNLAVSIHRFWQQPVALHGQRAKIFHATRGNQHVTWQDHMRVCDGKLYRIIYQECPMEVESLGGGTISRPKTLGGADIDGQFRSQKINLIATAIYQHTALVCSTK